MHCRIEFRWLSTFVLTVCFLFAGMSVSPTHAQSTKRAVFVTNYASDSVTSFTVNIDDTLTYVGTTPTGDAPQCISLSPNGKLLAIGHGTSSSTVEELIIYAVNPDATLTQRLLTLVPDSPLDCQWLSNTILSVAKTSLSDDNYLITYEWDDLNNSLTTVDMGFAGDFHTSIAVSFERSMVFANSSLGLDSIYAFGFDASGTLTSTDAEITDPIYPLGLGCTEDGNFVYSAGGISGSGNEILAFSVDASGALTSIPGAQSPGQSPKVIDITSDGMILVAGHGTDATVQSFIRNPTTGLISPSGFSFDVGTQGNLGDLQVVGNLMFVTDESTSDNGVKGLYSFRLNNDGTFTQNGPIVDTLGSRPEYIAVWAGPGPVIIVPDTFTVTRGIQSAGGLAELVESDNVDLTIQRNNFDINSVCEFEIKAQSPTEQPGRFDFTLEASVFARALVNQTISLYNYDTGQFEQVDTRPAQRITDLVTVVEATGDLSRFVEPGTRCIEVRVRFQSPSQRQQFAANIDLTEWTIEESSD